jgi:hypothetical protein
MKNLSNFKNPLVNFCGKIPEYCCNPGDSVINCEHNAQWGALRLRAEIIPTEPDPDNAGAGMAKDITSSLITY